MCESLGEEGKDQKEPEASKMSNSMNSDDSDMEVEQLPDDECRERPDAAAMDEQPSRILEVKELISTIGNNFNLNIAVQGIFVKPFKVKEQPGSFESNKHIIYKILTIELADLNDQNLKVRISVWGDSIELFRHIKPKVADHLVFKNLSAKPMTNQLATKYGVIRVELECNATDVSQFEIVPNLVLRKQIKYWLFDQINEDWACISLKAEIVKILKVSDTKQVVTVKQNCNGVNVEKEVGFFRETLECEWHPKLAKLRPKMFCTFNGIHVRVNLGRTYLSVSEYTRIVQIEQQK